MFKQIAILAFASLIVGCASTSGTVSKSSNGLENYNLVKEQSLTVENKDLSFITFEEKQQTIVSSNGKRFKETKLDFGSGIQWNQDYIVTAKHVAFVENSVYKCMDGCDIQFVKSKSNKQAPVWRQHVAGEKITFLGIDQNSKLQAISGNDLNIETTTTSNTNVIANLANNKTFGGMSGGPAYAADGKVVGMLTGGAALDDGQPVTVYLSYEVVKAAWDKFQSTQVAAK